MIFWIWADIQIHYHMLKRWPKWRSIPAWIHGFPGALIYFWLTENLLHVPRGKGAVFSLPASLPMGKPLTSGSSLKELKLFDGNFKASKNDKAEIKFGQKLTNGRKRKWWRTQSCSVWCIHITQSSSRTTTTLGYEICFHLLWWEPALLLSDILIFQARTEKRLN